MFKSVDGQKYYQAGRNPNWVDADGNYHEPERDWEDNDEEDYYSKNFTEDYYRPLE